MHRFKHLILIVCLGLMLAGCGRKEPPQVTDERQKPQVVNLNHVISGNSLKLDFKLAGGADGIGFQIDRTEQDPGCKCPSFWRRHYEQPPAADRAGKPLVQMFNLQTHKKAFYFRLRAVDGLGRLSPWSKPIFAQAEEFYE